MIHKYWPSGLTLMLAIGLAACDKGVIGPTEVEDGNIHGRSTGDSNPNNGSANPGVVEVGRSECDIIGITARRVLSVRPGEVTLRVLAAYAGPGDPYVKVLHSTGELIGIYPLGDITLSLPQGDYHLFIFVEVHLPDGLIQCDGSVRFTIPGLPPPPPPSCQGDDCDPEPPCDDCEPPPPPCLTDCEPPDPNDLCADFSGFLCHATGTRNPVQLNFPTGIPPGHCKHFLERHSPGQGPKDFPGRCEGE